MKHREKSPLLISLPKNITKHHHYYVYHITLGIGKEKKKSVVLHNEEDFP